MPKANIHPKLHKIKLKLTNGTAIETFSSFGKEGHEMSLDLDPLNHPAWREDAGQFIDQKNERVKRFNRKFGDFDLRSLQAKKEE